jgi:hypothetical protein
MKTWSAKQLGGFLESVKDDRLAPLWRMLAMTGMRRGEACGLRWEDVDLEKGRLSVRRALIPTAPTERLTGVRLGDRGGQAAEDPTPRPQAHARQPGAARRHQPEGHLRAPRARDRVDHSRHVSHAIPAL